MDFEQRLRKAIERGEHSRSARGQEELKKALTEEELRNLHSRARLELSDHVEKCLRQMADNFPGFQYATVVSEDGWGAKITRDDVQLQSGGRVGNRYSRFEMLIRPFSSAHIVELTVKGTIYNREVVNRSHYQHLERLDTDSFSEMVDLWVLEYAEQFAARD
ncbi:MAG: hypothetical protein KDA79_11610 [Planctomycetaceae bacterium]|nr:hypothetical protein [Planctomycetaceae bacterium]